ncbi:MAG TPA: protein-glutamine glutaminase family protein [Rugosimonospora sp.]
MYDVNRNPVALVNEPVRLYRPRDDGASALLDVVVLTGTFAGLTGRVPRDRVLDDKNGYVKTEQELTTLAAAMEREMFKDTNQIWRPIPFLAASMYCWARASVMATLLKKSGYKAGKLMLINHGGLRADSIFGDDMLDPNGATGFSWKWHIAPVVFLGDDNGPFVIDPSLLTTAALAGQWTAKMNITNVDFMLYDPMVAQLMLKKRYPGAAEPPWLVLADDDVIEPPDEQTPQVRNGTAENLEYVVPVLEEARDSLPRRFAIGALNTIRNKWLAAVGTEADLRASTNPYGEYRDDLANALQLFNQLDGQQRRAVTKKYPILLKAVGSTFHGTGIEADIAALFSILDYKWVSSDS